MSTEQASTLAQVMETMRKKDYREEFSIEQDAISLQDGGYRFGPEEFVVDEVHRFEGATDPGDEAILYALRVPERNLRGVAVEGYGIYSRRMDEAMIDKLGHRTQDWNR